MRLLDLPQEVLIHVLSNLDMRALVHCSEVCKQLHTTVQNTTLLQYLITLGIHGLCETPSSLPIHARLAALQAHTTAWRQLLPRSSHRLPLPRNTGSTYELYGSLFVRGLSLPHGASHEPHRTTDALHVLSLPSAVDGTGPSEWVWRGPAGVAWSDFTLCPADDLVVLVERRAEDQYMPVFNVHLLTLSTGAAHPHAKHAILTHTCTDVRPAAVAGRQTRCSYLMQVCGSLIAVLFLPNERSQEYRAGHVQEELVVWDWRTGEKRAVYVGDLRVAPKTFSFLSESELVVAGTEGETGALDVCTVPPARLASTSTPEEPPPTLIKRARFLLPTLRPSSASIISILTRSDPSPVQGPFGYRPLPPQSQEQSSSTSASASSSYGTIPTSIYAHTSTPTTSTPSPAPTELFHPAPHARVLSIAISLDAPPDTVDELTIFVLVPTLLALLRAAPPPSLSSPEPLIVPWPVWCPYARVLDALHSPPGYVCYVHGYRYVTSVPFLPPHAQAVATALGGEVSVDQVWTRVTVLDFNPVMLRRIGRDRERERAEREREAKEWTDEAAAAVSSSASGATAPAAPLPTDRAALTAQEEPMLDQAASRSEQDALALEVEQQALAEVGLLGEQEGDDVMRWEVDEEGEADEWVDDDEPGDGDWIVEDADADEDEDEDEGEGENDDEGDGEDEDEDEGEDVPEQPGVGASSPPTPVPAPAGLSAFAAPAPADPEPIALPPAPGQSPPTPTPPARRPSDEHLIVRPSVIRAQDVFVDRVTSGLGLVMRQIEVPGLYAGLFVDGERVIGMLLEGGPGGGPGAGREVLDVHVF